MKSLADAAGDTYVEVNSGGAAIIARAVSAATNPTEGQRMLQNGFDGAILGGESRENISTTTDANGIVRVDRVVERSTLSENGQEILVQEVQQSVDIEMATKAEHAAQASNVVTKAEFNDEIKKFEYALVASTQMVIDGMKTQTTTMTKGMTAITTTMTDGMAVVSDSLMRNVEVILKAYTEKHAAMMDDKMGHEKDRVEKNMMKLRKSMQKKIKETNAERDAKDKERDDKDKERDAKDKERDDKDKERDDKDKERDKLIASLQRDLCTGMKRSVDHDDEAPIQKKPGRNKPSNISHNGKSNTWGYKKTVDKTKYKKHGFKTMEEAVKALAVVLKNIDNSAE